MEIKKLFLLLIAGFVCNLCAVDFSKKVYIYMEDITAKIVDYKKSKDIEKDIEKDVRVKFIMWKGGALIDGYGAFTGTPQNCYDAIMAVGSSRGLKLKSLAAKIRQFVFDRNNGIGYPWQKKPNANPCNRLWSNSSIHRGYHNCRCENHKGSHKSIAGIPVGIGLNIHCTKHTHHLRNVVGGIKYTDVDGNSHGLVSCGGLSECDGVIIKGPC